MIVAIRVKLGIAVALFAVLPALAAAQPAQMPVIKRIAAPAQPPGAIPLPVAAGSPATEIWNEFAGGTVVRNVTQPTLTPFLPDPAKATGAAVVVAPGGGFKFLSMENEGWLVGRWLAEHGIAAFVLKYRVDQTPADENEFIGTFARMMSGAATRGGIAIQVLAPHPSTEDALAAIRMVRSRAKEWHVDPARVGIVGFSAGAMLSLRVALTADATTRPSFAAPIYPPLSQVDVPSDAPPVFVAIAADDPLFGKGGFGLIESWRKANRPIEFHFYDAGGHGFGMARKNTTSDLWIDQFYAWMKARGLLGSNS